MCIVGIYCSSVKAKHEWLPILTVTGYTFCRSEVYLLSVDDGCACFQIQGHDPKVTPLQEIALQISEFRKTTLVSIMVLINEPLNSTLSAFTTLFIKNLRF